MLQQERERSYQSLLILVPNPLTCDLPGFSGYIFERLETSIPQTQSSYSPASVTHIGLAGPSTYLWRFKLQCSDCYVCFPLRILQPASSGTAKAVSDQSLVRGQFIDHVHNPAFFPFRQQRRSLGTARPRHLRELRTMSPIRLTRTSAKAFSADDHTQSVQPNQSHRTT